MKYFKKSMAVALAFSMVMGTPGVPAGAAKKGAAAKVRSVSIQKPDTETLVLKKDEKYQLKTKVVAKGNISKKVTFKSSNSKVVSVSKKGKLAAKKKGTAKITVTTVAKPVKKAVLTVKVGTPVKKVSLSAAKLTGKAGETASLKVTVTPKDATVKDVEFTSSNSKVAKVSKKGKVSFLKEGKADITAKAQDGSGKKAVCKVTVTEAEPTATPAEEPTVTPSEPTETPAAPTETPAEPTATPAEPTATPAEPTATPAEPTPTPVEDGDALIKNGSFNAGFTGYEPYVDASAAAEYAVNSKTEDNAAEYTISNTGDQDWKIQLKQNNVELEQEAYYRLTLQAKSTMNRKFMYAIQRDGSKHGDDWTPYCQTTADLTDGWQTFTEEFQMTEPTDKESVLSISMGSVGGTQITEKHTIYIDNIKLEKIEKPGETTAPGATPAPGDPSSPDAPYVPYRPYVPSTSDTPSASDAPGEVNLIKSPNFENESDWSPYIDSAAAGNQTLEGGKAEFDITNPGTDNWNVQLKQTGIPIEKGATYKLKFKAVSTVGRTIQVLLAKDSGAWYIGEEISLTTTEAELEKLWTIDVDVEGPATLQVNMGKINNATPTVSKVTLSEFSLVKVSGSGEEPTPDDPGSNLIKNFNFASGKTNWTETVDSSASASAITYDSNQAVFNITNPGTDEWHIQLKQEGIKLDKDCSYTLSFDYTCSAVRKIYVGIQNASFSEYQGDRPELETGGKKTLTYTFTMSKADTNASLVISMGNIKANNALTNPPNATITFSNFSLVKNE